MNQLKSSEFKAFIYGTMLGDSYIHKVSHRRFGCGQVKEDVILYKKKIIETQLNKCIINYKAQNYKQKDGRNRQTLYRLAIQHDYFRKIRERFYKNGIKRVDTKILEALDTRGLAIWFADDGTTNFIGLEKYKAHKIDRLNNRRVEICTDGFLKEDVVLIKKYFDKLLNTDDTKIINRDYKDKSNNNPTGYRIRLANHVIQPFFMLIKDEFINNYPSMLYKLDLGFRNESLDWRRYVSEEYQNLYEEISAHPEFIDRMIQDDIV